MSAAPVNTLVELLTEAYGAVIRGGGSVKLLPSVMLWGPPGVGKSQGVRQFASKLAEATSKRTSVTDVRLLLFNPIDLRGIPTANEDKTLAVWLKPKIFQMDDGEDLVNILFLDEISAAPPSVQAAAYQITLDRTVGEHRLPDNCIVIAAGNRVTDKSVAYKMPKALANRLCHFEIVCDFDSWREWAVRRGVNARIIGFLDFRPSFLMDFEPGRDDLAFATPRSWEMASNILNYATDPSSPDVARVFPMLAGCIGIGAAAELRAWCAIYDELPDIRDIFAGKNIAPPKATDVLYALVSSIVAYARTVTDDMTAIDNSIKFAHKLPPDFATVMLRDYLALAPDYKSKLMRSRAFTDWLGKYGSLFNYD
jgi:MoxR-like ATPase